MVSYIYIYARARVLIIMFREGAPSTPSHRGQAGLLAAAHEPGWNKPRARGCEMKIRLLIIYVLLNANDSQFQYLGLQLMLSS